MLRGRRSRNKVSVGEPAEGSIIRINSILNHEFTVCWTVRFGVFCSARRLGCRLPPGSLASRPLFTLFNTCFFSKEINITLQLLAMDVSAQATMKDAAKCDKRCEWQNSANQENVERILHF